MYGVVLWREMVFFGLIMQNFYSNYLNETNVMDFIWNNLA